jgi:molecular chaperone DnaK
MSELKQGIFGIDLGTTYSAVAYIDDTGRPVVARNHYGNETTPSVVHFETESNVVVGQVAKESAMLDEDHVVSLVKRQMGNADYAPVFHGQQHNAASISALILKALAGDAAMESGREVSQVVISVPAYFGILEKEATRQAGEIAGLVVGIVPEPVAAALAYGVFEGDEEKTLLVYDLGGGTFDITIIRITPTALDVVIVDGDHKLGGADWDRRIFDLLRDAVAAEVGEDVIDDDPALIQDLWNHAEETKKRLSMSESRPVVIRTGGGSAKVDVTRAQFEQLTRDLVDQTIQITERALASAEEREPGITQQITDVLLVGGSSKMPMISAALSQAFGWSPKLADPDLSVAKGAALYAAGALAREWVDRTTDGAEGPGTVEVDAVPTEEEVREGVEQVAASFQIDVDAVENLAARPVSNSLPKSIGVALVDTTVARWDAPGLAERPKYIHHIVDAQTSLPYSATEPFIAGTAFANAEQIVVEIYEQAGGRPGRELHENAPRGSGVLRDLGPYNLPAGSPIHLYFDITTEGLVRLRAVEPKSGRDVHVEARVALLTQEEFEASREVVSGLRASL